MKQGAQELSGKNLFEIDKQQFGTFIAELRKEKGYTQKDLAGRLFVSDKAVSKWERGLSMPDISLLVPLADILGVTVTELLKYQRLESEGKLDTEQVEEIVKKAINFSGEYPSPKLPGKKVWGIIYVLSLLILLAELGIFFLNGYTTAELSEKFSLPVTLGAVFGIYFCFMAKEKLPTYYDENKISAYSDGIFRMNLPGVTFNNSNWPYILCCGRIWSVAVIAIYPLLYYLAHCAMAPIWNTTVELAVYLVPLLGGLFVPMYIVAKKYE